MNKSIDPMKSSKRRFDVTKCLAVAVIALIQPFISSCGTWSASRTVGVGSDAWNINPCSMYHKVKIDGNEASYGCSFIEFDHSGDLLEPEQLKDCLKRVESTCENGKGLIFVYCHGWHHNSQSNDVEKFHELLSHYSSALGPAGHSVHGVYLAWPGSVLSVPGSGPMREDEKYFSANFGNNFEGSNILSYWSKKGLAANRIGTSPRFQNSITRICLVAHAHDGRVVVSGHSFGALVLERALASDMLREASVSPGKGSLPDLMFFFNSAAPATDAFQSVSAMLDAGESGSRPRVVSVTSRRDFGTNVAHFVANSFSQFLPSNQRWHCGRYPQSDQLFRTELSEQRLGWTLDEDKYGKMFEKAQNGEEWFWRNSLNAAELQRRTPGFTDSLISHGFINSSAAGPVNETGKLSPSAFAEALIFNLTSTVEKTNSKWPVSPVLTCDIPTTTGSQRWNLHPIFDQNIYDINERYVNRSPYWVIPLPDAFLTNPEDGIKTHNDVWTQGHFLLMATFMKSAGLIDVNRVKSGRKEIRKAIIEVQQSAALSPTSHQGPSSSETDGHAAHSDAPARPQASGSMPQRDLTATPATAGS